MRLWKAFGILWMAAMGVAVAWADGPKPEDFARGIRLETPGAAPVYRLALPDEVYRTTTRDDLGDIRVFNAAGEPMPHTLIRPRPAEAAATRVDLPFFPLHDRSDGASADLFLQFRLDGDGTVIRAGRKPTAGEERVQGYLVDASGLERSPEALILDWAIPETGAASAVVEAGDDLSRWRPLVPSATLARLRYGGHSLERRTIPLPDRRYKYLRIRWLPGGTPLGLTRVKARLSPVRREVDRRTLELAGRAAEGDDGPALHYDSGGRFPVDRATVAMNRPNSLMEGALLSRPDGETDWRVRHRGLFYRLTLGGTTLESGPIRLPSTATDRFWRLEAGEGAAGMDADPPALILEWTPHELVFLAGGDGPFTLAFGSGRAESPDAALGSLLETLKDGGASDIAGRAALGETVVLGGGEALRPPAPLLPWRQWALWAVLVAGVLLLGWMAWRLHREMGGGDAGPRGN
jgi:hypothetical protein